MMHDPIPDTQILRVRPAPPTRPRLIGPREIVVVMLAFALLAIVPSVAQIVPSTRDEINVQSTTAGWDAEYPAANFPGSAFFYLDPAEGSTSAPTAALSFVMRAGTTEHARALKCLTDAVYYEAANEPDAGQRGVAQVILNRMRHPSYPNTVCGVIYQGSERATGCQFSYSCDGSMARVPARASYLRAQRVAADALAGYVFAPVDMATHYHATYVYPYWAPSLNFIGTIGAHRFYSWKGSAGQPSAFYRRHAGYEPIPGPRPRIWSPVLANDLDPVALQKRYEQEFAAARLKAEVQNAPATYAAPAYPTQHLPDATNVRSEYQNSGTWKNQPTG